MVDKAEADPSETFTEFDALLKMQEENLMLGQKLLEDSKGHTFKKPLVLVKNPITQKLSVDVKPNLQQNDENDTPRTRSQIMASNLIKSRTLRKQRTLIKKPVLEAKKDREIEKEAKSLSKSKLTRSNLEVHEWFAKAWVSKRLPQAALALNLSVCYFCLLTKCAQS